jgi:O-antigen ligase/polysaccharide polymerase Wzy-like membrane protein
VTTGIALAVYVPLLLAGAVAVWRAPIAALYAWIVLIAVHNAVGAALYGAGVRGSTLTAIQAWKEILLAVALARVAVDVLRARALPFRPRVVDGLALAYGALACVYFLIPQHVLGGAADRHATGLALKHDLIPVAAYLLGRSVVVRREQLVTIGWTLIGAATVVAAWGLIDDYAIPISWWRRSAVVPYFHKQLGYDYHGTGGLPENFIYNVGSDKPFLRRLVSSFLSPLASAYMLVVALLLAAVLRRTRWIVGGCIVIAAGLLFTFSRSSLIALAAGLIVLGFVLRHWWPVAVAAVTIGVSTAWVHVFPSIAPTGRFTHADLVQQHANSKQHPGANFNPTSANEPSLHEHWRSLVDGARTVVRHPQGYGLGNAGQTASRTRTPIKAGESNYTEMGAEMGILGSVLWTAWILALLVALITAARASRWWAAIGVAAAFAAAAVLAVQTDVIGDPWMGYVLWTLAGICIAPVALLGDADRSSRRHRARPLEGGRPRPRTRVLP